MPQRSGFLLFFLLLNSVFALSQTITGIVIDNETKEPLAGVHITSKAIRSNTFSEKSGKYTVQLKPGFSPEDPVSFTSVGYNTLRISPADLKANAEIFMTPATDELRNVNLNAARKLNKNIRFEKLASMEKGAYAFGSVLIDDRIYVVGGDASRIEDPAKTEMARVLEDRTLAEVLTSMRPDFSWDEYLEEIQVYDPAKDQWTISPIKVNRRAGHNVIFQEGKLYIFGGKKFSRAGRKVLLANNVEIFDLQKDSLVLDPVYPHQAVGAAAFKYNGDLLLMGGSVSLDEDMQKTFTNEIHLFNFHTGLWFDAGKLPVAKEMTGAIMGDRIYFMGGNDGKWLSSIESLDLATGKWKKEAQLEEAFEEPAVVAHGKIIYVYEKGRIHLFDTGLGEMKTYRVNLDVQGPALHIFENRLYLIGGFDVQNFNTAPSADCYSIALEEFDNTEVFRRTEF